MRTQTVAAPDSQALIRPRTAGEILDDAWRLAFAHGALLMAMSGLFTIPAAVSLLLLLTQPRPANIPVGILLALGTATLFILTGLGSGACQAVFRRRAEGQPIGFGLCLWDALRQGIEHLTARALVLLGGIAGLSCLVMPGLAIWVGSATVHPNLAEGAGLFTAVQRAAQLASGHSGKAAVVTLSRIPLLGFAVLNLHLLSWFLRVIVGDLTGIDMTLLDVLLTFDNPVYLLALVSLAWIMLTPFAEAANYLLHVDARTRSEGLDLWYRVRRQFPSEKADRETGRQGDKERKNPVASGGLPRALVLGLLVSLSACLPVLLGGGMARADDLASVRKAHQQVDAIAQEVKQADPYPGGQRWAGRLVEIARRLDPRGDEDRGPYRWFYKAVAGFAARDRAGAVSVLEDLSKRLGLLEEAFIPEEEPGERRALSREEIKKLLPERSDSDEKKPAKATEKEKREPPRRDDEDAGDGPGGGRGGAGVIPPNPVGGFGAVGWIFLAGALGAVLILGIVLFVMYGPERQQKKPPETGDVPKRPDLSLTAAQLAGPESLWRDADNLAEQRKFLEAVRMIYLAVLATLHRAGRIRYEAIRTNGEYLGQIRAGKEVPERLPEDFHRLTLLFEVIWYGEGAANQHDYTRCRRFAEDIRDEVAA